MAWTKQQKAAHSSRMKAMWARKALEREIKKDEEFSGEWVESRETSDGNLVFVPDMVNHPAHYTFSKYEVADVSDEWFGSEPLLWNANKYTARWDKKGDPIENLEKAVWYIQRKINQLKEKRDAKV